MTSKSKITLRFLTFSAVLLTTSACQVLEGTPVGELINQVGSGNFPVSVAIEKQTIDGAGQPLLQTCEQASQAGLGTNSISDVAIDINSQSEVAGNGGVKALTSLTLQNIALTVVDVPEGDTDNFDFLESIAFYGKDENGEQLIAKLDPVPRGATRIVVPGTDFNLKNLASSASFTITTKARGRLPCDDVTFTGSAKFLAKPF